MLPLFSFKIKIHNTRQREIKILLLKTNNKRNTTIDNSVKKVMGIAIRSWIAAIFCLSHASLQSLKATCVRSWMGRYIKPWTAKRDMRKANQRPRIGNPSFDFLDYQKQYLQVLDH